MPNLNQIPFDVTNFKHTHASHCFVKWLDHCEGIVSRTNLYVMGISLELKSAHYCNPEPVANVDSSVTPHSQFSSTNGTRMKIESSHGD